MEESTRVSHHFVKNDIGMIVGAIVLLGIAISLSYYLYRNYKTLVSGKLVVAVLVTILAWVVYIAFLTTKQKINKPRKLSYGWFPSTSTSYQSGLAPSYPHMASQSCGPNGKQNSAGVCICSRGYSGLYCENNTPETKVDATMKAIASQIPTSMYSWYDWNQKTIKEVIQKYCQGDLVPDKLAGDLVEAWKKEFPMTTSDIMLSIAQSCSKVGTLTDLKLVEVPVKLKDGFPVYNAPYSPY